jgi:large repetitive protein
MACCAALLLAWAVAPSAALALPSAPALTRTTPASPGTSTEPRIHGFGDGVVTSVFRPRGAVSRAAVPRVSEPGDTITLYTDPGCSGPVAATGTNEELEGVGIPVVVAPESVTTFYATRTNFEGTSLCSNGITYRQVSTAPAPPVFTGTTPGSGADQNFPRLQGTADSEAVVFLYETPDCSGSPVASGSGAEFAAPGIEVHVPDNSTTTFHALATLAGLPSTCSTSSISFQEVTPTPSSGGGGGSGGGGNSGGGVPTPPLNGAAKPPAPQLRTVPNRIANDATPVLVGKAPQAVAVKIYASADCSGHVLGNGTAAELATGIAVAMAPNSTIALSARSLDSDGDQSSCSEPVVYTDDSIAPRTRITAGPGAKTLRRTVVFRFADITGGPETSFLCKLDGKPWRDCQAPLKLKHLGHKRHVLRVKAYDAAGNREKRPVKRSFQVVSHG